MGTPSWAAGAPVRAAEAPAAVSAAAGAAASGGGAGASDRALVRIRDLAGRPRGTGFVADHHGTVVTSHEAVDGLPRLVLHTPDGNHARLVPADAVTALPALGLALVHCDGLGLAPLPITVRNSVETGTYVRIAAGGWREARVLGSAAVTYPVAGRCHPLPAALELAIGTAGSDALRPGGGAAGGPVVDAATGAVVAVLGTALHSGRRVGGLAVPLFAAGAVPVPAPVVGGPLAELLVRNAATVPAYGADLNLAGVLELTATVAAPPGSGGAAPVERAAVAEELTAFTRGPYGVLGLVGAPGSGRTTELAALAARRNRGAAPAPTLWLHGADLLDTDGSVADAARRALERAGRIVAAGPASAAASAAVLADAVPGRAEPGSGRAPARLSPAVPPPGGSSPALASPARASGLGDIGPERLARLAGRAGRPLLFLLDSPEEMPPGLADRLPEWAAGTAGWLREHGVRLVVACREEYWEQAGAQFPSGLLYGPRRDAAGDPGGLPACVRLGDLEEDEAREARARYGIPDSALGGSDARHPLTLRLLSEVRAALPAVRAGTVERDQVFAAYLDLMCLRVAVRLAAANGLRGTAVRRLAARVAGQVHVAARRGLGPGEGELDRAGFETLFPWGPVPDRRLGGCTGWASAVLAEGLLVPAGDGYRFAHEEFADWIQGMHLDLDSAFGTLMHRRDPDACAECAEYAKRGEWGEQGDRDGPGRADGTGRSAVPRHRVGAVLQALLLLPRQRGQARLTLRLRELLDALDGLVSSTDTDTDTDTGAGADAGAGVWWATRLLGGVLLRVPDATPYLGVLRHLAGRVVRWRAAGRAVPKEFGPGFWRGLPLPQAHRFDLLRRLVVADGAPPAAEPRYLDTVSDLLAADPAGVQPYLTHWFDDDRPLPATPDVTVATAAQVLLHTHRRRAPDDLTEALVDSGHARAGELLDVLAEEEPSALCRAVHRWARDERPARRTAAATYGLRAAAHVRAEVDRELLRRTALALLARPGDCTLHGSALALLVRDPHTRARHLPQALARFRACDPRLPASALAAALATHPGPVLAAFRDRLREPGYDDVLRTLVETTAPALARRVTALMGDVVERRPETATRLAVHVDRRLEHGPGPRAALYPLVAGLLGPDSPPRVRAALAEVLAAPGAPEPDAPGPDAPGPDAPGPGASEAGTPGPGAFGPGAPEPGASGSGPLRREFLDLLLAHEHEPVVLDALLRATAEGAARNGGEHTRALVHTVGRLLGRTPDGAARFDRVLVDLGRRVPGFAPLVAGWLAATPEEWSTVVGPGTGRMVEEFTGARVLV